MRSIWAVARNTIAQALRMKVAVTVIVLLILMLVFMVVIVTGDGTLKGKLQTFTSYGLSLTSLLLCMLTIIVSTFTLTNDLKSKQIYLVLTKPICRYQVVCGKFLGIILMDMFLLAVFACIIYGLTTYLPVIAKANDMEKQQAGREFFTARASIDSEVDEDRIIAAAQKRFDELKASNELPKGMSERKAMTELVGQEHMKERAVEAGGTKLWKFENVRPMVDDESIYVQFKLEVSSTPPDGKIYGMWVIGDDRQGEKSGPGQWEKPPYPLRRTDVVRTVREFAVPAAVIGDDGYVAVQYFNAFENQTTVIPEDVRLLYRAGTFGGNYFKAVLMIFARLVFLAALGVSASTWLSFPVAVLVCVVVFFTGTVNGFIMESFDVLGRGASVVYMLTFKPLLMFLPRFDGDYNPTQFMVTAEVIRWQFIGRMFAFTVAIKSAILILLGTWFFSNREIAKIVV